MQIPFSVTRAAVVLLIATAIHASRADDLDVIVDPKVSAEARGQAYDRLTSAKFPEIAAKLATLLGTHPVITGIGPRTKQPWSEQQLSEGDRIAATLLQLWHFHIPPAQKRDENLGLLLTLLEDSGVGQGRHIAISEITAKLHWARWNGDPALPAMLESSLSRLDKWVRDAGQPNDLRRRGLTILFEHGDPNQYLDLAINLASQLGTPLKQGQAFWYCTESCQPEKFTEANRKRYVRYCRELLEKIDDRRSSVGNFLAMQVRRFLDIPPVRPGQGSFAPDQ